MFGRSGLRDALEAEQAWLREHEVEFSAAWARYQERSDLQRMLDQCALALATLQCLTNESSVLMAGNIIGTAEEQLEAALKDRTTIHTYESRKANYESMKESGSPIPDLGLGAERGERER